MSIHRVPAGFDLLPDLGQCLTSWILYLHATVVSGPGFRITPLTPLDRHHFLAHAQQHYTMKLMVCQTEVILQSQQHCRFRRP
jgi:hypothetical protein